MSSQETQSLPEIFTCPKCQFRWPKEQMTGCTACPWCLNQIDLLPSLQTDLGQRPSPLNPSR